ncbi:MAG: hypothetical protein ACRDJM_04835 [Actinomycetota bacterium]
MDKSLLDKLQDGDAVAIALRGGAGWVQGTVVWKREGVMLIEASDKQLRSDTPYVLVLLEQVTAIATPHKIDAPGTEPRTPGFNR